MREVEVKILEIDCDKLREKLVSLGAKLVFSGELDARFYDYADAALYHQKQVIRLRREGEEVLLTHKKQIAAEPIKIMDETETEVGDMEKMHKILLSLGLVQTKSTRKMREIYQVAQGKVLFDTYLDDLAHIPTFAEIETEDEQLLNELVHSLGFEREDCKSWNTYQLETHYSALKR